MAEVVQWLAGRDYARTHPFAGQMLNFAYLVGDPESREAALVDPAWAPLELAAMAERGGWRVVAAIATHTHPDHVGGDFFGVRVPGIAELARERGLPVFVHEAEGEAVRRLGAEARPFRGGDVLRVGGAEIEALHAPGHTPGSAVLLVDGHAIAGDVLFPEGCGRVDLPGGDADEMFTTLHERLAAIPDPFVLLPGHAYAGERALMRDVRARNPVLRVRDRAAWRRMMGA